MDSPSLIRCVEIASGVIAQGTPCGAHVGPGEQPDKLDMHGMLAVDVGVSARQIVAGKPIPRVR